MNTPTKAGRSKRAKATKKKKNHLDDLPELILRADARLQADNCQYPDDHYTCYIREWESIVELAKEFGPKIT